MIDQYPPANGVLTSLIWRKTAAGGETSLSGYDNASQALSYTPGQEQVYLNGILLVRGSDYTATNGTSITSLAALAVDDFVQINCYNNFSVASVPAASITGEVTNSQITSLATSKLTGTVANNQLTNSSITINGSAVSLGGSVSLPGDIESVTAGTGISGGGSSGAVTITNSMATAIDAKGDLIVGTGADTFARLPVGASNGQILTVDSAEATGLKFATPASGGGMTLLSTTALSGTSTTVSSISQSYKHLLVIIRNAYVSSSGSNIDLRFNGDSGSNYVGNTMYSVGTGTPASSYNTADTSIQFIIGIGNSSSALNSSNVVFNIYRYTENETKFINGQARGATNQNTNFTGAWNDTSAITSIYFNTGISAGGGTIYIYGVN